MGGSSSGEGATGETAPASGEDVASVTQRLMNVDISKAATSSDKPAAAAVSEKPVASGTLSSSTSRPLTLDDDDLDLDLDIDENIDTSVSIAWDWLKVFGVLDNWWNEWFIF